MSKRQSTSQLNNNNQKKSKVNNEIYGGEVNSKDVEECIDQISQVTQTYTQFLAKHEKQIGVYSSTPIIVQDVENEESICEVKSNLLHLRNKNYSLTQENVMKNGEIAILRNQLKQLQHQLNLERSDKFRLMERKQSEWLDKLNELIKDKNALQSELEFKSLEMMHLRQKSKEIKQNKAKFMRQSIMQSSFPRSKSSSFVDDNLAINKNASKAVQVDFITKVVQIQSYQKKMTLDDPEILFELPISIFNQLNANTAISKTELTQTQITNDVFSNVLVQMQCPESIIKKYSSVSCLYDDLMLLMLSKQKEIDQENINAVKNIFLVSVHILIEFEEFLNNISPCSNMSYLLSQSRRFCWKFSYFKDKKLLYLPDMFDCRACVVNEFGIVPRLFLAIISRLLTCSVSIWKMINDKISSFTDKYLNRNENFIELILNLIVQIEKTNRSDQFTGFLSAVLIFLKKYIELTTTETYFNEINRIVKIITLTKPDLVVLYYLIDYINRCVVHKSLAEYLCENSKKAFLIDLNNHKMIFNFNSCLMQILIKYIDVALNDKNQMKIDNKIKESIFENILETFQNILRRNLDWTKKNDINCKCVKKIYFLTMRLIYDVLNETYFKITKSLLNTSVSLLYEMIIIRPVNLIGRNFSIHGLYCGILVNLKNKKHSDELIILQKSALDELLNEKSFISYLGSFTRESPLSCKLWNESFDNIISNENLKKRIKIK